MATPDGGFAAIAYGPSTVTVPGITIDEQTDYPFRDTISLTVKPAKPTSFPLVLRIPAWATSATVTVNGQPSTGIKAGEFYRLDREWKTGDRVELRFPMEVRTSHWFHNSIAVERGPLVYSLKIGESWHKLKQTGPASDWEVFPTTPWNYALIPGAMQVKEQPMSKQPYTVDSSPIEIAVQARRLPEWQMVDDSAGPLPVSPVSTKQPLETLTLIPYGAAKLRITAFPFTAQ